MESSQPTWVAWILTLREMFVCPLTDLVFNPTGCVSIVTPGVDTGLVYDDLTMQQAIVSYMVAVELVE